MTSRLRSMATLRDWVVLALFLAYATPFFWQLLTSLKPEAELMVLPPLLPTRLTWEHYRVVLGQSVMLRALINSLGVGAITTALALALGLFGAYGIARYPVPGKGLLLLLIVVGFPSAQPNVILQIAQRGRQIVEVIGEQATIAQLRQRLRLHGEQQVRDAPRV